MIRSAVKFTVTRAGQRSFSASAKGAARPSKDRFLFVAATAAAAGVVAFSMQPTHSSGVDIKKVKEDIADAIAADDERRGDGTSIGPTLVRLAWHAAGTYSTFDKTGGSNGATMRFDPECSWGANAGLKVARDFLEGIKKKHGLSYADTWTLAGGSDHAFPLQ